MRRKVSFWIKEIYFSWNSSPSWTKTIKCSVDELWPKLETLLTMAEIEDTSSINSSVSKLLGNPIFPKVWNL